LKLEVLKALSGCSAAGVHHEVAEQLERRGAEGLGEDVGDHTLGGDVVEFGRAGGDVLADEVVADVDVTHAMAGDLVERDLDRPLIVLEERGGPITGETKLREEVASTEDLLHTGTGGLVLGLRAGQ
jgi:hypothetical protein